MSCDFIESLKNVSVDLFILFNSKDDQLVISPYFLLHCQARRYYRNY